MGTIPSGGLTFFFDRNCGRRLPNALGLVGVAVRHHDDFYEQNTPDPDWIKPEAALGHVIVSCDHNTRRRPAERAAYIENEARVVFLPGNLTVFQMLQVLMTAWPKLTEALHERSPLLLSIDKKGRLKRLDASPRMAKKGKVKKTKLVRVE